MKIKNVWSLAALVSIALTVTACSGNPVDVKNSSSKPVVLAKAPVKNVAKKVVKTAATAKKTMKVSVAEAPIATVVKAKPLTPAQSIAKKRSIASLGKSRQNQARIKYARAQARKKYLEKQRLQALSDARKKAIARNTANESIRLAGLAKKNLLGLERFKGSQAKKSAVNKRLARKVGVRSVQPVATRAKQPVVIRAKQPIRTRSKQPVRTRGTQYAARAKAPARNLRAKKANIRRVAAVRSATANRSNTPRIRKAVYKKPARRANVSRIDPNVSFGYALSGAAIERTKQRVRYDGKYVKIGYPWGDVPKSIGVCTDVVIRAYRRLGIDLQQEVHQDISKDFYAYPNLVKWGLTKPDPNIDHRRVYNLQAFFKRHKAELPRSRNPRHYKAGDLVTWMVGPNFPHIGVVVDKPSKANPNRLMIAHNIGYGPQIEDILFRFPMTGHYRYTPQNRKVNPALLFAKTPPPASVIRKQRSRSLSYAEMLQASKILSGKIKSRTLPSITKLRVKSQPQEKIMLAHLDANIVNNAGLDQNALKVLLK